MVYALRIPEFRQGLHLFCFRSQENSNTGRNNMAADHNNLKFTFKQEVMEDTKLWLAVAVRRGGARWALRSPPSTFCTNVEHVFLATTLLIFTGNVNKRQYLKVVIQIWRNLAEILFKSHFVKESIKSKVSEAAWSPCVLGSVKAGLYRELWRHRISRLRADNRARENAWAESER